MILYLKNKAMVHILILNIDNTHPLINPLIYTMCRGLVHITVYNVTYVASSHILQKQP